MAPIDVDGPPGQAPRRWPEAEPIPIQRQAQASEAGSSAVSSARGAHPAGGSIRRFVDPKGFAKTTDEGLFEATGNRYRNEILSLLADYRALSPPGTSTIAPKDVVKALTYVNAMIDFAQDYLRQPTTESEPEARTGYWAFLIKARERQKELETQRTAGGGKATKVPVDPRAKTLRTHMVGDGSPLFNKVGWAVDKAVPKNGDKASFTVDLDFPTPWGFNAQGGMQVSAERNDDRLKAFARISIGAGVGRKEIAMLSASIGGYLEAEAGDPTSLGALLERALYERVKGSSAVPSEVVGYLFGTGGDSGGLLVAQERMAAIDATRFKDGNYSESGVIGEAKVGGEGIGMATGGLTSGTRLDSGRRPGRSTDGLNYSVKVENPIPLEMQVQAKRIDTDKARPKVLAREFTAEVVLDQKYLVALSKSADAAMLASKIFSVGRQAVGLIVELANANQSNAGITSARLLAGLTMAQGQLIYQLNELRSGLPDPDAPAPTKGLASSASVGLGIKSDLVANTTSVVIRHMSEVSLNPGTVKAIGTRSSEATLAKGKMATPPPPSAPRR